MMSNSESRKRQAEVCEPKCHGFGIGCGCNPNPSQQTIAVKVTVDTDELREWAGKHADSGHHGVAHVLYKAASDGESLTDQAIREAVEQARAEVNAGWAAVVQGARDDIRDRKREFIRLGADPQYLLALDDAWGLVSNRARSADHTAALDAVKADAAREALLAAAEAMEGGSHTCFRPAGCVDCGRQRERDGRVEWLRSRAEAIENG